MKHSRFFILGAARCGTTSLYHGLKTHPHVLMSTPKEPFFFESDEYHLGLEWYRRTYFPDWSERQLAGDSRTKNLFLPFVADRLRASVPESKFIVILRNPVDRAYSHWWYFHSRGFETLSFEDALEEDVRRIERGLTFEREEGARLWADSLKARSVTGMNRYRTYVDSGYYSHQLRRYLGLFDASQLKIVFFEHLIDRPQAVLEELLTFLELDPALQVGDVGRQNASVRRPAMLVAQYAMRFRLSRLLPKAARRWGLRLLNTLHSDATMSPAARQQLLAFYRPHNRDLETLVGCDLSHWDV